MDTNANSTNKVPHVAILGDHGSNTEIAAVLSFSGSLVTVPCSSTKEVICTVNEGRATYAALPIYNTTEGAVTATYDELLKSQLTIVGEMILRVQHSLIANNGVNLGMVKRIYSHPQALAQSVEYLKNTGAAILPCNSTSEAAKRIKLEGLTDTAAVANPICAQVYEMRILADGIQTYKLNSTRFLLLAETPEKTLDPDAEYKTSIAFWIKDRPASLYNVLGTLARRGINVTSPQHRPIPDRPWEHVFYMDLDGHQGDKLLHEALCELRDASDELRVLGSYKKGEVQQYAEDQAPENQQRILVERSRRSPHGYLPG